MRRAIETARRALAGSHGEAAQEKFERIFQASLDAVAINSYPDGRYLDVNAEFLRISGYERCEIVGRTPLEVGLWQDREQLRRVIRELEARSEIRNFSGDFRMKGGDVVTALFSATLVTIGEQRCVLSFVRDVTEIKRAEEALRASEEKYRSLFEDSNDAVVLTAPSGEILDVNPAGVRLFGFSSKEELLRVNVATLYASAFDRRVLIHMAAERGVVKDFECQLKAKDGRRIEARITTTAIHDASGRLVGYRGITRDVTAQKRLEEQLLHSQKLEAVGRLAGGVAHDFNNLLMVVQTSAFLGAELVSPDHPAQAALRDIEAAAKRAADLTRQLLAFARRQMIAPKVLNLNHLILDLAKLLRRLIGEHIELVTLPGPGTPIVRMDPGQIEQLLVNLTVNARDAMPDGGKLIIETAVGVADPARLEEGPAGAPRAWVSLVVRDTGCGMAQDVRQHAFEPFFTTKGPGKGTGLGLATCYGIVAQAGGRISVESEPGQGTTFRILLPWLREGLEGAREAAAAAGLPRGSETVLLVEDEAKVRSLLARILRGQGYRVLEASRGDEALRLAEAEDGPIELVISDIVMPHMSGWDLVERLSTLRPELKVLYVSGYTDDVALHQGELEGGHAFLQKPFTPDILARKVRELLDGPGFVPPMPESGLSPSRIA